MPSTNTYEYADQNMDDLIERSKTNENLTETLALINTLPDDIKRKIYEDCFEGKALYKEFLKQLKSQSSKQLQYHNMIEITERILKFPCVVEYLCKKSSVFDYYYKDHFILNKTHYVQKSRVESFIFCILMHLYH